MEKSEQPKFMVRVNCLTFNHVNYITDTMNGFTMQQTDFPFVCCIMDDASTDGEQEVIKKYLKDHFDLEDESVVRNEDTDDYSLTFARHRTNQNCYFAVFFLKYNHYSIKKSKEPYLSEWQNVKYFAPCEGDDYWLSPVKLQNQHDVMESHPECTIAFHRVQVIRADGSLIEGNTIPIASVKTNNNEVTLLDFCRIQFQRNYSWSFHTSSFFYRNTMYFKMLELQSSALKNFPFGDAKIVLTCLTEGKGFLLQDIMSCYRAMTGVCAEQRHNDDYRLAVNKKIIMAYNDFDDYTNREYHDYFKLRILRAEVECKMIENKWALLLPKYWPITTSKSFLRLTLLEKFQSSCPSFYSKVRSIYRKMTGNKGPQV